MAEKSIYRDEYKAALSVLRTLRARLSEREGGLSQAEFAARIGRTQSWASAVERGSTRADAWQLAAWVYACGATMEEWGRMMDEALAPYLDKEQPQRAPKKHAKPQAKSKPKAAAKPKAKPKRSAS